MRIVSSGLVYSYVLLVSLVYNPPLTYAWGEIGHKIIGTLAEKLLTEEASNKIAGCLGTYSLADISPWPDNFDHSTEGHWSASCHYVNLPKEATSFSWDYCKDMCVIRSIANYTEILQHEQRTRLPRCKFEKGIEPCSVEFLAHYIGDVHQPLHVGYAYDHGGTELSILFFGDKTNLHEVWDSLIIEKWDKNYKSAASFLEKRMRNASEIVRRSSEMDPVEWANESIDLLINSVYNFTTSETGVGRIEEEYYRRNLPLVWNRLIAAGVRVANLFNTIFKSG